MTKRSPINRGARFIASALVHAGARPLSDIQMQACALIVAPHPDDETLGCGGTALRKIESGATVHVVFTTDGSGSHRGINPGELAQKRKSEATAACAALGIDADRITFLAFADGKLSRFEPQATDRLAELLRTVQPTQIFAPYRHDNHPDHLATNRAVVAAIVRYAQPCTLLEYPVWFWEHWPWMSLPPWMPHRRRRIITRAVRSPLRGWRDFNRFVDVTDVLDRKRTALAAHETQMTSHAHDWTTLDEISDGEFLPRLLRDREIFAERRIG